MFLNLKNYIFYVSFFSEFGSKEKYNNSYLFFNSIRDPIWIEYYLSKHKVLSKQPLKL